MHWAWEQQLVPSLKLVLMALADAADDSGQCWPSVRTIAAKCCISERTVQRVMKDFKSMGLLLVEARATTSGRQTSNCYYLALTRYPDKLSPSPPRCGGEGDTAVTPRVSKLRHPPGDIAVSPLEPPDEHIIEPPPQPAARKAKSLEFPDRLTHSEQVALIKLLDGVEHQAAQLLLDELAGAMQTKGTIRTSPVRWFRALVDRMRQGQFSPTAGIRITQRRVMESERPRQAVMATETPVADPAVREAALRSVAESRKFLVSRAANGATPMRTVSDVLSGLNGSE